MGSALVFHEVELDAARFELRRQGAALAVQPKVLRLLLYLAEHRERAVSVAELLEHVWPAERVTPGSVKRAILCARRALGDSGCTIRTIRGAGYRFVEGAGALDSERAPQSGSAEPFVGREGVLELLEANLAQALKGPGELVLLVGEPGIGKSRTVHELGARAAALGADVWISRCLEEDGAPAFWPWIQTLRECVLARGPVETRALLGTRAGDLAEAIPELRGLLPDVPAAPEIDAKAARFRAFDAMASFLRRAAERRPIALVFDDLHRADRDTLQLLDFLAQPSSARLLLAGTLRRASSAPEGTAELVRKLATSHAAKVVELDGLRPCDVARFIEAMTGACPPADVVEAVHERTAGNPLFCRQLLLRFRARLTPDETPPWHELACATRGDGLLEATERHLEVISLHCRALLTAASVLGRQFSVDQLARITEHTPSTARDLLREAADAGIVQPAARDTRRFTHALIRDALYASLSESERTRLHARAGLSIEARRIELEDEELAEAAHHFHRAAPDHDGGRALVYAEKAANRAMARLAHEEAIAHADRGLRLLELGTPDPPRRLRLLLAKGRALARTLEIEAVRSVLLETFALANELAAVEVMVEVVSLLSAAPETGAVDAERIRMLERTLELLPPDGAKRPMVTALLAKALCYSGQSAQRARLTREALSGARLLGDPALRGEALHYCHHALSEPDDLPVRIEIADELALLAERHGDDKLLLCASLAQLTSSVETGDMGSVDAALATMEAVVRRVREPFFKWYAACARSMRSMVDGKLVLAETQAREALALGRPLNHESAYHTYVTQVWSTFWLTGRVREAEALVREISCRYPGIAGWRAVLAGIDLDLGRKDAARRALARLASQAEKTVSKTPYLLSMLAPLADLCARIGDAATARTLYDKLLPYARHHGFVHLGIGTHGPLTRHLGLLAARIGELDLALEHLSDAVARAERMASPVFVALCSFAHARVLLATPGPEARERASVLLWKAAALSLQCGMTELHARCRAAVERFALELHGEPNGHRRITAGTRGPC